MRVPGMRWSARSRRSISSLKGSSLEGASARLIARRALRGQRAADRFAVQPGAAADLLDRDAVDHVHPPDLRPLLHVDHPLLLASISSIGRGSRPGRMLRPCAGGSVFDRREGVQFSGGAYNGKKIRKTFPTEAEARSWQADAKRLLTAGRCVPTRRTLEEASANWLAGAERGDIRIRSGHAYKPATLRGYRQALGDYVLAVLGSRKLNTVTTADLQDLVDGWQAEGQVASTIRNSIKPLQAIYRRARSREGLAINPTHDLELPARDRRRLR